MLADIDVKSSEATLRRLLDRAKRQSGIQLPRTFVRGTGGRSAPLAKMVRGGRGGEVRLKLFLSVVLLAGGTHVHKKHGANAVANVSSSAWARALALPEPDSKGARRVADAQTWLSEAKLLAVRRQPGTEPFVQLLSADGGGRKWSRPTQPYVTVPIGLWSNHWMWFLDASELAVLIALLDFQGGRPGEDLWMEPEERMDYGLSPETWRTATMGLADKGLVDSSYGPAPSRDFETARRRRTYRVEIDRLSSDALEAMDTAIGSVR